MDICYIYVILFQANKCMTTKQLPETFYVDHIDNGK